MVLTEEQKQDIYPAATLEGDINSTNSAVYIENKYYSIDATKIVSKAQATGIENQNYPNNNTIVPNNNPNSVINAMSENLYELKANSTAGVTGLGITLKVMAGDKIDILGKSYYFTNVTNGNTNNKNIATLSILTGLLGGPTGGTAAAAHGGVTAGQLDVLTTTTDGIHSLFADQINEVPNSSLKPQAFINYIFFDEQFKSVDYGYDPVGDNSVVKSHYLQQKVAPKNGYVYIYVSNQSQVKVFFDNLQVVHTRGAILEETHYYPFGLTMAGISSKALNNAVENKYRFNGGNELQNKEFSDGTGLDWYDANFRGYEPQIGRFLQVDPLAEIVDDYSPYTFAYNNPILINDPLGLVGDTTVNGVHYDDARTLPTIFVNIPGKSGSSTSGGTTPSSGTGDFEGRSNPFETASEARISPAPIHLPKQAPKVDINPPPPPFNPWILRSMGVVGLSLYPMKVGEGSAMPANTWNPLSFDPRNPPPTISHDYDNFYLVRFGPMPESQEKLASDATRALANGFPHGVSAVLRSRISGSDRYNRRALVSEVRRYFNIYKTGVKPDHYTVELPSPVTQEVADYFNSVFRVR